MAPKRRSPEMLGLMPHTMVKIDFSDTVTILVGRCKKPFNIHKATLTASSQFFTNAVNIKDDQKQQIELKDVDTHTFQRYAGYMYSGELENNYETNPGTKNSFSPSNSQLVMLYILGEKVGDVQFCNEVLWKFTLLWKAAKSRPTAHSIRKIWRHTSTDSTLRSMVLEYMATKATVGCFEEAKDILMLCPEFLLDYSTLLLELKEYKDSFTGLGDGDDGYLRYIDPDYYPTFTSVVEGDDDDDSASSATVKQERMSPVVGSPSIVSSEM